MSDKLKVFIVGGGYDYAEMFKKEGWEVINEMMLADLVQFTGGSDVSPFLYEENKHPQTGNDPKRDQKEEEIFNAAKEMGIPMAGICRGGQFLNVMNGGKMFQHVNNHASGPHVASALGYVGKVLVTSTHHQMMIPAIYEDNIVLMTARESTRREKMGKFSPMSENGEHEDVEAIYYPDNNCLCYQPHPEFTAAMIGPCREVYFHFINNYLLPNVTIAEIEDNSKVVE